MMPENRRKIMVFRIRWKMGDGGEVEKVDNAIMQ
jgi:hypothetical protein